MGMRGKQHPKRMREIISRTPSEETSDLKLPRLSHTVATSSAESGSCDRSRKPRMKRSRSGAQDGVSVRLHEVVPELLEADVVFVRTPRVLHFQEHDVHGLSGRKLVRWHGASVEELPNLLLRQPPVPV